MAATAITKAPLDMAILCGTGNLIPVLFCIEDIGTAIVTGLWLSLCFQFQEESIHIEEEVFENDTGEVSHTISQLSFPNDSNGKVWFLLPGKFVVYGLTESQMAASTVLLTPRRSSTCTMETPAADPVDVESSMAPARVPPERVV